MDSAERAGELLREAGATVAVAETATGGLLAARLSGVPGASDYFDRAYVPYDYDALRGQVGVPREILDEHGAVSAPVTRALARRARDRADATFGVSTTGVAGPAGGTAETPVGTVFVGVARAAPWGSGDSASWVERHAVEGDRDAVRQGAATVALQSLAGRVETLASEGGDADP